MKTRIYAALAVKGSRVAIFQLVILQRTGERGTFNNNSFNHYDAEIFFHKPWISKGSVKFEIILNVLVSPFRFI